jgi:hypothetical protein
VHGTILTKISTKGYTKDPSNEEEQRGESIDIVSSKLGIEVQLKRIPYRIVIKGALSIYPQFITTFQFQASDQQ